MGLKREKFKKMEDLLLQGQKLCRCWKIAERIWIILWQRRIWILTE